MRNATVGICGLALALASPTARAWGPLGHQVIADVAEHYLTPAVRAEIEKLLDGKTMADVADWPDTIRKERKESAPWHYVNIPPDAKSYDAARDCPKGDCVVGAIEHFTQVVADRSGSHETRAEALRFLIHFVGDVHQPLHCGRESDLGGNTIKVTCMGEAKNLHWVWDITLPDRQKLGAREYAAEIIGCIDDTDVTAWTRSSPGAWATESFDLAYRYGYASCRGRPIQSGDTLGRDYLDQATVIMDGQFARAGVRLAHLLNAALSGTATQPAPAAEPNLATTQTAAAPATQPAAAAN